MNTSRVFLVADARRVAAILDDWACRIHAELDSDLRLVGILQDPALGEADLPFQVEG